MRLVRGFKEGVWGGDLHEIANGHDDLLRLDRELAGWVHDQDLTHRKSPQAENTMQKIEARRLGDRPPRAKKIT